MESSAEREQFLSLKGKVAVVTGASRGIGEGIALELAKRGAKIVITYSSPGSDLATDRLIERINALRNGNEGSSAIKVRADFKSLEAPAQIISAATEAFGNSIDILVNNAGVEMVKELPDLTPEDFSYTFDINVRATFFMTQAILPHLRVPGRIINVTSVGARGGFAKLSCYCASKAAVEGFTRSLAAELGPKGHTVNAVEPGPTETEMIAKIPVELVEMQKSMTPVENRMGRVDDIAQVVAWLSEEQSRWISGQTISASGGFSMI